ncbi:MAG: prepilin-type N-terminal cleavage/methylation domain-containing protein [Planctomycetaceae bacterium]|jgi:prepilin-type N-terminal cleavage/methylation domain-containing protein|nr:prepilin-type N-terminal cleavage/methylation domain-containing protein [Planctomycetaceae bacterium]
MFILTQKGYTNMKKSGFTLIELLIVIGLLAALAAVLLPTLMGDREDALEGICSYNQAGTLRTLRQYEAMTGKLPNGMHTGLQTNASSATPMQLPPAFQENLKLNTVNIYTLTTADVAALEEAGITKLAYGTGSASATGDAALGYETVTATTSNVIKIAANWQSDGAAFTFNAKGIPAWEAEGYANIIALFITPTVDWTSASSGGWVKGFNVSMDIPGTCPIPNDENTEFAYYVAYIGLKTSGYQVSYSPIDDAVLPTLPTWSSDKTLTVTDYSLTGNDTNGYTLTKGGSDVATVTFTQITIDGDIEPKAVLIGTSCPECGITNP